MAPADQVMIDANEAAASVAFRVSETIAIYSITPSSTLAELCDQWVSQGKTNLWGVAPQLAEMQSEGGAAGAVHGALQAGALATTFTSIEAWMREHEWGSLGEMRGNMSLERIPDPAAYERANLRVILR